MSHGRNAACRLCHRRVSMSSVWLDVSVHVQNGLNCRLCRLVNYMQFKLYSVVVQPLLLINGQCQEFFDPFLSYKKNGLGPYEHSTTNSREYLRKLCVALVSLNRAKEECFD